MTEHNTLGSMVGHNFSKIRVNLGFGVDMSSCFHYFHLIAMDVTRRRIKLCITGNTVGRLFKTKEFFPRCQNFKVSPHVRRSSTAQASFQLYAHSVSSTSFLAVHTLTLLPPGLTPSGKTIFGQLSFSLLSTSLQPSNGQPKTLLRSYQTSFPSRL